VSTYDAFDPRSGIVVEADDPLSVEDATDELSDSSEGNELAAADRKSGSVSLEYMVEFVKSVSVKSEILVSELADASVDVDGPEESLEELVEDESHCPNAD
jgi:hypothetical protein